LTVPVTVSDGTNESNTFNLTVSVTAVNDAPVLNAIGDQSVEEEEELTFTAQATDTDLPANTLSYSLEGTVPEGAGINGSTGEFSWTPTEAQGPAVYTFTVKVCDTEPLCDEEEIEVTVTEGNVAPVAADDTYSTDEDENLVVDAAAGVLANDVDTDTLTATVNNEPGYGTVTLAADGSFTYDPVDNFYGTDSFTYTASDGTLTDTATVTITVEAVNDAPVCSGIADLTVDEDAATTTIDLSLVYTDVDSASLSYTMESNSNSELLTATVMTGEKDLTLDYAEDANGTAEITVRATDTEGLYLDETFTVTVMAVNDAPTFNAGGDQTVADDAGAQSGAGGATGMSAGPANESDQTLVFSTTSDNADLFAVAPDVDETSGTLTYTPAEDANGEAVVTVTLTDSAGGWVSHTFSITVNAVNDAPEAAGDSYSTEEDTELVVAIPGVLGNDSDEEGAVTAERVSDAQHGSLELNSDGSFSYEPDDNFNGEDSFTYRAYDGELYSATVTVTIVVTAVNDVPVGVADVYDDLREDTVYTAVRSVLANDSDVEGSALTASVVTTTTAGTLALGTDGLFTYTPGEGFSGTDSFTYRAYDGTDYSPETTVTL